MGWDGDISRMGRLAENIGKLAGVPSRASRRVAQELRPLIQEQFDEGADPYGRSWKPLAPSTIDRGRFPPPLTDTGEMRDGIRVQPMRGAGVSITIPHPAQCHQTGWIGPQGTGPARPILPGRGMPPRWQEVIDVAILDEIREAV